VSKLLLPNRLRRQVADKLRKQRGLDTRRLSDGTPVAEGLRVVFVREVLVRWGLGHGYDDKVHLITSTLDWGGRCGLVELGPRQEHASALAAAPRDAEVTCKACAGWHESMARLRADNERRRLEREAGSVGG
jgi:hypothetical protein